MARRPRRLHEHVRELADLREAGADPERRRQRVDVGTLDTLQEYDIGMLTTVLIGNSATVRHGNLLVTPQLSAESRILLYRQVKVSMTKWAVFQRVEIEGVFEGSPSRFEEQYHLPLRQADGASLSSVTYDQLIERIEKG
ncbi:MAG: hypothetical protein HYS77_15510, partial [Candidatus Rokubacteria bacterium]|nr:hypothetical protein [Candidatus Rokubacteria bacterium]